MGNDGRHVCYSADLIHDELHRVVAKTGPHRVANATAHAVDARQLEPLHLIDSPILGPEQPEKYGQSHRPTPGRQHQRGQYDGRKRV